MKINFNLSSKYNQMAAVIAGGLVLAVLISLLLIRPAWNRLEVLGQEIPTAQQKRDLKKQDYENLQQAKKFLDGDQQSVEAVNTAVPIEPETPSILVMLESLAKQNGVFLTSFTPQQIGAGGATPATGSGTASGATGTGGADAVQITANFQGPYSSLINFLFNLEVSLRLVDVKTITVTSSSGNLQGSISFLAYYKQVDGGPKAASSAGTAAPGTAAPGSTGTTGAAPGGTAPGGAPR